MNKNFFDVPTQVRFFEMSEEVDDSRYSPGIAYKNEVICACCGAIFEVETIEEWAREAGVPPFFVKVWYDFGNMID